MSSFVNSPIKWDIGDLVYINSELEKGYCVFYQVTGLPSDYFGFTLMTSQNLPGGQKILGNVMANDVSAVPADMRDMIRHLFPPVVWTDKDPAEVEGSVMLPPETDEAIERDIESRMPKRQRQGEPAGPDGSSRARGAGGAGN